MAISELSFCRLGGKIPLRGTAALCDLAQREDWGGKFQFLGVAPSDASDFFELRDAAEEVVA